VFFFARVFALAMDYTVFLLATVKEHFDETGDARRATIAGLAHTGRLINAAGGVMVIVFFHVRAVRSDPAERDGRRARRSRPARRNADPARSDARRAPNLLGARAWWIPRWLNRILPEVNSATAGYPRRRHSKDARPRIILIRIDAKRRRLKWLVSR
jgi:RND superfamily putative drug exporter